MSAYPRTKAASSGAPTALCDEPWPNADLEIVRHCPACGARERSILFEDLCDTTFFIAPGRWTMWRCERCRSGYLDPRPTPQSIGRAYGRYYTHEEPWVSAPAANAFDRLRARLANGYRVPIDPAFQT